MSAATGLRAADPPEGSPVPSGRPAASRGQPVDFRCTAALPAATPRLEPRDSACLLQTDTHSVAQGDRWCSYGDVPPAFRYRCFRSLASACIRSHTCRAYGQSQLPCIRSDARRPHSLPPGGDWAASRKRRNMLVWLSCACGQTHAARTVCLRAATGTASWERFARDAFRTRRPAGKLRDRLRRRHVPRVLGTTKFFRVSGRATDVFCSPAAPRPCRTDRGGRQTPSRLTARCFGTQAA